MSRLPSLLAAVCLLGCPSIHAQSEPAAAPVELRTAPYDAPPALLASQIFPVELLTGLHYRVRSEVVNEGGVNRFTIDTDEGVFIADGNEMLPERLREINAIYQLRQISKGEEYKSALKTAATAPLDLAKGLVNQPKETVRGVAKGAWRMMERAGDSIRGAMRGRERSAYSESVTRDLIGFSEVKRNLAISLGVDPYSRNPVLQKALDEVAWTSYAGQMTFSAALLPLSGGAAVAANGLQMGSSLRDSIRDNGPEELRFANQELLNKAGLPAPAVQLFLDNPAFSPVHQTRLTRALESLKGVEGLDLLLDLTRGAMDEDDARFFQRTTELIAALHTGSTPLTRIVSLNGFPVCLARDGSVVVALHLDYVTWSPVTDHFLQALLKPQNLTPSGFKIVLSGTVSPTLRAQLGVLGIGLAENVGSTPVR